MRKKKSVPAWAGYYDNPASTKPDHDPGRSAACPLCNETLGHDTQVRTHSVMPAEGDRSYFFRVHKLCEIQSSHQAIEDCENLLIDGIN